jgi:hypothetical protein
MSLLRKAGLIGAFLTLGAATPAFAQEYGAQAPCPAEQAYVQPTYNYGYVAPRYEVAPTRYVYAPRPRVFVPRPHFFRRHFWR